jgi:nuclear pore complex protein Nup107
MEQAVQDDFDPAWFDDVELWGDDVDGRKTASEARTFWELESLVKVLDTMETLASLAELSKE